MTNNSRCPVCKSEMKDGFTDITFRRERSVIVIEHVPACKCINCGEAVIELTISQKAYEIADREMKRGVILEFRKFAA